GVSTLRPNVKFNSSTIGSGTLQNSPYDYPAPYGNWYWSARNQMLFLASELTAAGLSAGPINSLSFSVAAPDGISYTYLEIKMNNTSETEMTNEFLDANGSLFHTNFKIGGDGETVYLFDNTGIMADSLHVNCAALDVSIGSYPDAVDNISLFGNPTPASTNSAPANGYTAGPLFDLASGVYNSMQNVTIYDPNNPTGTIRYTLDGSTPNQTSPIYNGQPIPIYQSRILRARVYLPNRIPSNVTTASYLFNVAHQTPIISVSTSNSNLYGATGIFDHWDQDWLRDAHVDYFDSIPGHPLLFSTNSGMMVDGGAGGSRSHPQHSFRLEMANSVLGEQPIIYPIIPNRPNRNKYSDFYLRNGSNQYLVLPYKDACQVHLMCNGSNTYFSAWRPVTVYINGQYFGLYELREKYNKEMFKTLDNATNSTTEILSLSYWNGGVLRAVDGDVNNFWDAYNAFSALDQNNITYWDQADQYFD
ncbi:MAG: chitobiase/beta-hexosaminidase C-terminal domain-containing protein, partial [Bacteroidota bacterium]